MPISLMIEISLSISSLQCFPDFILQLFHTFCFCSSDMRLSRYTASAPLGMAKLQQMRQLIAVPGMHHHSQAVGCFLPLFYRPAFRILSGVLRSMSADFIPYRISGFPDRLLYILSARSA